MTARAMVEGEEWEEDRSLSTRDSKGLKEEGITDGDKGVVGRNDRNHHVFFEELDGDMFSELRVQLLDGQGGRKLQTKLNAQGTQQVSL